MCVCARAFVHARKCFFAERRHLDCSAFSGRGPSCCTAAPQVPLAAGGQAGLAKADTTPCASHVWLPSGVSMCCWLHAGSCTLCATHKTLNVSHLRFGGHKRKATAESGLQRPSVSRPALAAPQKPSSIPGPKEAWNGAALGKPRDAAEAGGGGGGGGWLGHPSSLGPPPPMVPAKGGPKNLKLKSSWRRSKLLAVSLKHWKGKRGGGYPPSSYSVRPF